MNSNQELVFARPRVFFFHYNRPASMTANGEPRMSVHIAGQCHIVRHINCQASVKTKENKQQPYVVMSGKARRVTFTENSITLYA